MEVKQFQAESKRLLDLMINSIYTHKEIFLRELISNASDALDKLYYRSLTDDGTGLSREDFKIELLPDEAARTLTLRDNGIGMTREELESNLGTIAKSGSLGFKKEVEQNEDIDIIGQFGVGFYSAFMVSDKVTVTSRAYGEEKAYCWESEGSEGFTVTECEKAQAGTEIVLHLKPDTEDEQYSEFLDEYRIRSLIKKYSDYIRYPIQMEVTRSRIKEGGEENETEQYREVETLNSMVPIWRKLKSELKAEDYNQFYKEKFFDFTDPLKVIHTSAEGVSTYHALLFIPAKAPYNFYSRDYERGLQLYSSGVLIMDKCTDLLPEHFAFVRGLVDSQDLSLNISREMLQHDRQLKNIATRLEKRIKSELKALLENEREKYEEFYESFGLQLKYGLYSGFGANKELLSDLILFHSSTENKPVTLAEYVARMGEGQKEIYYAVGTSIEQIAAMPQTELVREKGYEILYCTDDVDEFTLRTLREIEGKGFKSVTAGDLDIETPEEKEQSQKQSDESRDILDAMKAALGGKVSSVRLSTRLKSHAVCLTADGEISLEMEKVLSAMPNSPDVKAQRVLEVNAAHPVFDALRRAHETDKARFEKYAALLYNQALLMEGLPVEDPVAFAEQIASLMA